MKLRIITRLLYAAAAAVIGSTAAYAQLSSDFDEWLGRRNAATLPLGATEVSPVVQGGQTRKYIPRTALVNAFDLGVPLSNHSPDPTGVTDSQPAFVAAQTAAVANGSKTVTVGAGTYTFARRLNLVSGMRYVCLVPGSCTLKPEPVGTVQNSLLWYADTGIDDIVFDGFKWDGNMSSASVPASSLGLAFQASRIVIKNATLTNNRLQFFNFVECDYCGITDSFASSVNQYHKVVAASPALVTNALTAAGSPVLHFATVPSELSIGAHVYNVTTPSSLPFNATSYYVSSISGGDVTLSGNATGGGVLSGDTIQFEAYASKIATWTSGRAGFFTNVKIDDDGGTPVNVLGMNGFSFTGIRAHASADAWSDALVGNGTGCFYVFGAGGLQNSNVVVADAECDGYTGNVFDVSGVKDFSIGPIVATNGGISGLSLAENPTSGSIVSNGTVFGVFNNNAQTLKDLVTLTSTALDLAGQPVLTFGGGTTGVAVGMYVRDAGMSCTFAKSKVLSFTGTTVTLDKNLPANCPSGIDFWHSARWPTQPVIHAGLVVGCSGHTAVCTLDGLVFGPLVASDTQAVPTQQYGIDFSPNVTLVDVTFGNRVMLGNVVAPQSSYLGYYPGGRLPALDTTSIGLGFGALGFQSGTNQNNTAFGNNALGLTTTGVNNTAHGKGALAVNNSGDGNTAVGSTALNNVTSSSNTGLGSGVAPTLTTGVGNMVLGITSACDVEAAGTNHTVRLCAGGAFVFRVTGANTPSTSVASLTGALGIGGASLTLAGGELGFAKITASGSAPGAAGIKEAWVCGTNAGTAKKIAYAGTSTTPVTIIDNVGAGVTGC